jgi:histidinol-phosphate aminotransferase
MTSPTPRPGILDIDPYVPGHAPRPARGETWKLSSNESALGPSPAAMEACERASRDLHVYPDGSARALREAIAEAHGLDPARIVCGAGSDEILQLVTRAYAGPGDNIVQSAHGFLVYKLAAQGCGASARMAAEKNLTADIDAMLALVDDRTRLIFIANPNNPTGTYVDGAALARLVDGAPEDVIVVIDSAYAEYVEAPDYDDGAALAGSRANVVMTRTFSKIYGLGGLRLGWGYFPPAIADVVNRIRGPFNISGPAIAAGVAAIRDQDFVARNRAHNKAERAFLEQQFGMLGIEFVKSVGNFILARFPDAKATHAYLSERGVEVRAMHAYGLPDYLRISIGPTAANRRLVALLSESARDV